MITSIKLSCSALVFALAGLLIAPAQAAPPALIPWPKTVQLTDATLPIAASSRIVAADPKLLPLANVLAGDFYRMTGQPISAVQGDPKPGDIQLKFDNSLKGEHYRLAIGDTVAITGGTYRAVAWGTSTFLQALQIADGKVAMPKGKIDDDTDIKFRSAECDIARKWHPIANLYELIDLFKFYKVDHIMFHMNDHGMFTFGSTEFPELPTKYKDGSPRHYTKDELKALVAYADARGVTIIPEIEMPGHSDASRMLPKIFGTKDAATGEYKPSGYINVTRDDTVDACKKLLNEAMDVFASSEYISIGADEVADGQFKKLSEYAEFEKKYPGENPLIHFINAMNAAAKERGKKLLVYGRGGDKDVLQMPWSGNDNQLAKDGYMIIPHNSGSVTHHMPTYMDPPYNTIMLYTGFQDAYEFDFTDTKKIQPQFIKQVYGIQTLTWQHWHYMHFFDLRKTMSSISENAWNYNSHKKFIPFDQWKKTRWDQTNQRLDDLVYPVKFETKGLLSPGKDIVFKKSMTVSLSSPLKGTIRYHQEKLDYWNPPALPTAESPAYKEPITITEPTVIYARLFDDQGKPVGYGTERHYYPITPTAVCQAYPVEEILRAMGNKDPKTAMKTLGKGKPNTTLPNTPEELAKLNLKPTYEFPMGRLTFQPSYEGVYQWNWMLVYKGKINLKTAGDYKFAALGAQSALLIDGKPIVSIAPGGPKPPKGEPAAGSVKTVSLTAGEHDFTVIAITGTNANHIVDITAPGETKAEPMNDFLVPME